MSFMDQLAACRVLPVVTAYDVPSTLKLSEALARGGMTCVEITLRTEAGLGSIRAVKEAMPDLLVAAGTVTRAAQASRRTAILKVPLPLALYRHHGGNVTQRAPEANHKAEVIGAAIASWGWISPWGRPADKRAVKRGLARSWADFSGATLRSKGSPHVAWDSALRSLILVPFQLLGWLVLLKAAGRRIRQRLPGAKR